MSCRVRIEIKHLYPCFIAEKYMGRSLGAYEIIHAHPNSYPYLSCDKTWEQMFNFLNKLRLILTLLGCAEKIQRTNTKKSRPTTAMRFFGWSKAIVINNTPIPAMANNNKILKYTNHMIIIKLCHMIIIKNHPRSYRINSIPL